MSQKITKRPLSARGRPVNVSLDSSTRTGAVLGATGNYCRVFPASVEINGPELAVTHVMTLTILNVDKKSHRVNFKPPKKGVFVLNNVPAGPIAPGLEINVELAFRTDVNKDHLDELIVECETDRIIIPLRAFASRAQLEFETFCNFGSLAPDHAAVHFTEIVNVGTSGCDWRFVLDNETSVFKIVPNFGTLGPAGSSDSAIKLKVEIRGSPPGQHRSIANLEVNGVTNGQFLDLNALVMRQNLEVMWPSGGGLVESMNFGSLYYGQSVKKDAVLLNDGPEPTEYRFVLASTGGSDFNPDAPAFSITPSEGELQPFEQIPIIIEFHPRRPHFKTGFKCKIKAPLDERHDINYIATAEGTNVDQKCRVTLNGKAVRHSVSVSHHELRFGECMTNENLDIIVTLKNDHEELPVTFAIDRIVHFKSRPMSGRLLPLQSMNLTVSFAPNQMGQHKNSLAISICGGLDTIPISVYGVCGGEGLRKVLTGGPTKNVDDFKPTFVFVEPDAYVTSTVVHEPFVRRAAWDKYTPHLVDGTSEVTWSAQELERKRDHKRAYDRLIRIPKGAAEAEALQDKGDLTELMHKGGFASFADGADMGMEPYSGLQPPEPPLPRAKNPLWLAGEGKSRADKASQESVQTRVMNLDENRLFAHKFKARPTQTREVKDCKLQLSAADLSKILIHPKSIDFGKVVAQSEASKCFALCNDTGKHIIITIATDIEELSKSTPPSQVIPPGATAGFDITVRSETSQSVVGQLTYTINGQHSFKIPVVAEIVPVMLKLNKNSLHFKFPSNVLDPFMVEVVTLANPGNNKAEFRWINGSVFQAVPARGMVDALGSEEIKIKFNPSSTTKNEENLRLSVVGGEDCLLKCSGEVEEGKIQSKVKSIEVGFMAAGAVTRRTITLKNIGNNDAVFSVENFNGGPTITPSRGSITPGGVVDLNVTFRPASEGKVEGNILVVVRGGKNIRIPFSAEVTVPDVVVETDEIDFGCVYLGTSHTRHLSLVNRSPMNASLFIDLRGKPEFTLKIPPALEDDDDEPEEDRDGGLFGSDTPPQSAGGVAVQGIYRVTIPPENKGVIEIVYVPTMLEQHAFELSMAIKGLQPLPKHRRVIVAEATRPRVIVSTPTIDFKEKVVINEQAKKFAYVYDLYLTNCSDKKLEWDLSLKNDQPGDTFSIDTKLGELDPAGAITIQVSFSPKNAIVFSATLQLYLDRNVEADPYFVVDLKGIGMFPGLAFDRREVIFPFVPLGVTSYSSLFVINQGYDNLEVVYRLPTEATRVPVEISLPEGAMVGLAKKRLPVLLKFNSKRPMSFTIRIDFFDGENKAFSILVMGSTDACLLSSFPFLSCNTGFAEIVSEENKAPMLLMTRERSYTPVDGDHMQLLAEMQAMTTPQNLSTLVKWANISLFKTPVTSIPNDIRTSRGRALLEIIELYSGKPVPKHPSTKGRGDNLNRKEQALGEYQNMVLLCDTLKSFGALVNHIKAEFLLPFDDFSRLCFSSSLGSTTANTNQTAATPGNVNDTLRLLEIRQEHRNFYESNFDVISGWAWSTIIYQTIRIFIFSRINTKLIKSTPGMDRASMNIFSDGFVTGSNLYCTPECLLGQWLTFHHNKIHSSETIKFTNFAIGFRDGRTLAALLLSHIPTLTKILQPVKRVDPSLSPADAQKQCLLNLQIVCDVMDELRMEYIPDPNEIFNGSAIEMLLFGTSLFHTLPQYIPRTTIHFDGKLSDTVTKLIELSNPSSKPLTYLARLDGSTDFKISNLEVSIEPKGKVHFAVDFLSRFTRPSDATLYFTAKKGVGLGVGATLVFTLRATVENYKITESLSVEAKLYEQTSLSVPVTNPFANDCEFIVTLQEDPIIEEAYIIVSGRDGKKMRKKVPAMMSDGSLPKESFWCKRLALRVNSGDTVSLPLQFLPFRLSRHRCLLMFKEPDLGEFVIEVVGEVMLPTPIDLVKFTSENKSVIPKDIVLAPKNSQIEKTRTTLIERFGGQIAKEMLKSITESGVVPYKVEFSSPFFSGPSEININLNKGVPQAPVPPPPGKGDKKGATEGAGGAAGAANPASGIVLVSPSESGKSKEKSSENKLTIELHPKGPGTYNTKIILKSIFDCRIIEIESVVNAMGLRANLDFNCSARQTITQDIPIINVSQKEWHLICHIEGHNFFGPKEIRVGPASRVDYPLTFKPEWISVSEGELIMMNTITNERYQYTLKGIGEEPAAEDHVVINCRARWKNEVLFKVPNPTTADVSYMVESDLPGVSGAARLSVPAEKTADYIVAVNMPRGGTYQGALTFLSPDQKYVWFTVEVHAENPPEEKTVEVSAKARTAAAVDITIVNPTNSQIVFEVVLTGEGLLGNPTLSLQPHETTTYELIFSPLIAGSFLGSLTFVNDDVGEFWYKLVLTAIPADPVNIPMVTCEVGKTVVSKLTLENFTEEPVTLWPQCSNTRNFTVDVPPTGIQIEPWATTHVPVTYQPSSLSDVEHASVRVADPVAGEWVFNLEGKGVPPSDMDPVTVISAIGSTSSNSIDFRNPFAFPVSLSASLRTDFPDIFQLVSLKSKEIVVGAFKTQQIGYLFSPKKMIDHSCLISIESAALGLTWRFPINGVAEAPVGGGIGRLSCRARESVKKTVELELVGTISPTSEGIIDYEVVATEMEKLVSQSLSVTMNNIPPTPPPTHVRFDVVFEPMRAFRTRAELIVTRPSGGRWRFGIELFGTDADIDDVITIEGALKKTSCVSFRMSNQTPAPAHFIARFSPESPSELTVHPTSGMLQPFGSEGTNFIISFNPSEYGKNYTGRLLIETDDMQWTYEVRGIPPLYVAPTAVGSRVSHRLDSEVESALGAKKSKNYMKENAEALKFRK